jgi:hypothetical protein
MKYEKEDLVGVLAFDYQEAFARFFSLARRRRTTQRRNILLPAKS